VRAVNHYGYFNGAHTAWPVAVLLVWFAVGLALVLLRQWVAVRRLPQPANSPDLAVAASNP
jgi:hypothetical protein